MEDTPETETTARLTDYRVLTFDCYGTLIDWESGIRDALQPLIMQDGRSDGTRDAALLAFAQCESRHEREAPDLRYPDLLARVHRSIAERFGMETSDALDEEFGASVPLWPAFPDTADALRTLKRHYRPVILSNVHRDGFAASNRKLGAEFDAVCTAEDIGSYKPADANFEYLLARLESEFGLGKADILHTAQRRRGHQFEADSPQAALMVGGAVGGICAKHCKARPIIRLSAICERVSSRESTRCYWS